ncbi:MAG: LysR family transcriptional regulator [Pseudomonadota bacterium]
MRNLDMTTLRSFVTVAEQGGVTRAAAALNLTQSAVSMQIKRLEELLDVELFERANRTLKPTASGDLLLTYARKLVDLNDEAVGRLTDKVYEGEITLGAPYDIVYPVVPKVLKQFNALYPRVKMQLVSSSTIKLIKSLERGEVDLILTTEEDLRPGGETLAEVPLRWTGAPGGQAWKKRPLRLAFCSFCIFRPIAMRCLDQAGIDWELVVESEDDRAVEALVSADLAVGALMADSIPPHLEALNTGGVLPDLGVQKINMYGVSSRKEGLIGDLAGMLRQGFAPVKPPMLVTS